MANKIIVKQISEKKWFGLYDKLDELDTETFLKNICEKCKMYILLQYGDNNVGIYGVIKGKGLYGFTSEKSDFFKGEDNIKFSNFGSVRTFALNSEQKISAFIKVFEKFLEANNKNIEQDIELVYYQEELENYI